MRDRFAGRTGRADRVVALLGVVSLVVACHRPRAVGGDTAAVGGSGSPSTTASSGAGAGDDVPSRIDVALGSALVCVRARDGAVRCRGDTDGLGKEGVQEDGVVAVPRADAICTGVAHGCALAAGAVYCWGDRVRGARGAVTAAEALVPNRIVDLPPAVELRCGRTRTCTRHADGTVRCWGENLLAGLGDGTTDSSRDPVRVVGLGDAPFDGVVEIAAGGEQTCARLGSGRVACWGKNDVGQLGVSANEPRTRPVLVDGLSDVIGLASGFGHTCALHRNGEVSCWGWNVSGQLGTGHVSRDDVPNPVPTRIAGLDDVVELALGHAHSCARKRDGSVWCWGANDHGQLGDGQLVDRTSPVRVVALEGAVAVRAAADRSCAVRRDDTLLCWGDLRVGTPPGTGTATRAAPVAW